MSKVWLYALIAVVALVLIVVIRINFPFEIAAIKVAAEPLPGLVIPIPGFSIPVTNSLLSTWLTMLVLVLFALWVRRGLKQIPSGKQNVAELAIEALYGLTESVAGPKWAPVFFPIIATIFLFVLLSNLLDILTPLLAAVGIREIVNGQEEIIPILRSPSTDLNFTVGLALISVALTQYYGVRANGLLGYLGKFVNVGGFIKFFKTLTGRSKGNPGGALFMGLIDFVMGLIELISEIAKILSFSFRLFGNIFAGEVLLLVIPFLLSFIVPLPFLGLELFVGFIQAFVFAVLTLAFLSTATLSHGGAEHEAH
ncbi:MAG: F0F1 ATP synthase subunit A [Chloroflexota bacterium]|nr:F0F1 ATP synthase subunit A [Chloroflexota bacterium]